MSNQVTYAIHREDGTVISRHGHGDCAWPILDYLAIGKGGDFQAPLQYNLEMVPLSVCAYDWRLLVWTRYVPVELKNRHREFWGLKPLPIPPLPQTIPALCAEHRTRFYLEHPEGLIGIRHSNWGTNVKLYHWFTLTPEGYALAYVTDNVDDEHKGVPRRKVEKR